MDSLSTVHIVVRDMERTDMNKRKLLSGLLVMVVMLGAHRASAQRTLKATSDQESSTISTSDLTKAVVKEIQDIEERTVAIAEDFPGDLYNTYRPKGNEDVRTAAEILLHVAEQNFSYASLMRTKEQQDALIAKGKVPHAKDILTFVSKPDAVAKVKQSFAAVRTAILDNPYPAASASHSETNLEFWLYVIAHSNGHFGNLVTYYRDNGLVPPSSRQ
jgi:uncharacterized damage-inducible protein DinB